MVKSKRMSDMNCFTHQNNVAIGLCKACQKAVCTDCAIDTGRGLACSLECQSEVKALNQIVDKSKRIYSIGSSSKVPPTGVLMFLFFGAIFTSVGIYQYIESGRFDFVSVTMGLGFVGFSAFSYIRNKHLNLNC